MPGYRGENRNAAFWGGLYLIAWILQRLWCHLGLPKYCELPNEPLEVLTDILVLLVFALAQAWWVGILDEKRFDDLKSKAFFVPVFFITPLIISALGRIDGLGPYEKQNPGEDFEFSNVRSTIYIFALIVVVLVVSWHFAKAWTTLPGMVLISGGVGDVKPPDDNLLGAYVLSRAVIVVYAILFTSFLIAEDEGLDWRGPVIAYTLSLIAIFESAVSAFWLALCSGIFVQGIGSNRLRFLGCEP